jgi:hypothetical protein
MAIEFFRIEWTKLYPFDKALNQPEAKEGGVYALYKSVGGNKKLHYVGKSKDFTTRFGFHRQSTAHMLSEAERKKCYVSFGLISSFEKSRMTTTILPQQLRDTESFLINNSQPVGNDSSTKKGYKGNPIIIINHGKFTHPFKRIMTDTPELLKLIRSNLTRTRTEITRVGLFG